MRNIYEFKCTPPNERSRIVKIEAASLEEASQRAERLWCRQMHRPLLLAIVSQDPIMPLVTFGGVI